MNEKQLLPTLGWLFIKTVLILTGGMLMIRILLDGGCR